MRITPLALAAALLLGGRVVRADDVKAPALEPSLSLQPLPRGDTASRLPIFLRARTIRSQPDIETVAEGDAEFRRGGLIISADRLAYENPLDLAHASGHVRVQRDGAIYSGPELQLRVQRFEGYFLQPEFKFTPLGSGGRAERIDFLDGNRSRATKAEYTSCPREGPEPPAWVLRADTVDLDMAANEGVAEGAVLRFLDTPILALPAISFPLSDARKSGWLPPSVSTDTRSGLEVSAPYYWNIAPNRDATITPRVISRRGLGVNGEFRYLEPSDDGSLALDWLPSDKLAGRSREAWQWIHDGRLGERTHYSATVVRVSDDGWWKDFPNATRSITPRLLPMRLQLERSFDLLSGEGLAYARMQQWQVLQGADALVISPYERSPQLGARLDGRARGWTYGVETEFNRFTLPPGTDARAGRIAGDRVHLLGHVSYPLRDASGWFVPRLSVNAAHYSELDPGAPADAAHGRVIPTLSLDTGLSFERSTTVFGRAFRQTLEPRLVFQRTPYHAQSQFPVYDTAAKDFNFVSIYSDSAFSGVDRVADASQMTAGVTTRFLDAASGAEALRLGLVQRVLFRTQRVTAQPDGTPDGPPLEQRFSDALILGSTNLVPSWTLDAAVQYSPDLKRSVRSILGARYSPGPFRTVSATYRLARGLNEQVELAWQWPLWSAGAGTAPSRGDSGHGSCKGTWYGVGRVNYSLKDSRVTDSILGAEYDAGCWIGRIVAERLSTGRSEATTRLMVQLELVGLSRLGSNPLQVLKDNIPGYRLLRDERRGESPLDVRSTDPAL